VEYKYLCINGMRMMIKKRGMGRIQRNNNKGG